MKSRETSSRYKERADALLKARRETFREQLAQGQGGAPEEMLALDGLAKKLDETLTKYGLPTRALAEGKGIFSDIAIITDDVKTDQRVDVTRVISVDNIATYNVVEQRSDPNNPDQWLPHSEIIFDYPPEAEDDDPLGTYRGIDGRGLPDQRSATLADTVHITTFHDEVLSHQLPQTPADQA